MKAQRKFGLRMVAVLALTALTGSAQTTMGAQGDATSAGPGVYGQPNTPMAPANSQPQRTAYPGAINYVEGQAALNGQVLGPRAVGSAVVGSNQVVSTGNGYVEILLTPGAFLRIGHDSEAKFVSAGLTGVKVELARGQALVEVTEVVKGSTLNFTLNGLPVAIEKKGLYAFDGVAGTVRVLDGKADVYAAERAITLKKGDEISASNAWKKHDFNIKAEEEQPLYIWSKVRSEDEARVNMHEANLIVAGGNWYGPGWYWDPLWSGYAFMPGAGLLYSPFGWGFYSPAFYGGLGYGFYGRPAYYHGGYYRGFAQSRVVGVGAMHAGAGFRSGGGFHGGHR